MDSNIIFTSLVSFGAGVIGYLLNDLKKIKELNKNLKGLIIAICTIILEDDNVRKTSKDVARETLEKLQTL